MRLKTLFILLLGLSFIVSSCTDRTSVLPKSSGKANEVLLVMDDYLYNSDLGQEITNRFKQDVVGLPWDEPFFDVSRLNRRTYTEMFRIARNIVYIDVSDRYTVPQVKLFKDLHASGQAFVRVQSPNVQALDTLMDNEGNRILSYIYSRERQRTIKYFKRFESESIVDSVYHMFGLNMLIPSSFNRQKFNKDFVWMAAGNMDARQYLAIYAYPYKDDSTFTKSYLLKKRDEYMKKYIPGSLEGSYMQTSYTFAPTYRSYKRNGYYVGELRGLWETHGDMMGGPFISQTILDEENQMVITVDGFIYAPHKKKRNLLRQLESIMYTMTTKVEEPKGKDKE